MQTFLPYPDFMKSARCLDFRRLGKQRVECIQILNALRYGGGWATHPAVKMWKGHEDALTLYMGVVIDEWIERGYVNSMELPIIASDIEMPLWFGDERFHASHRSNLLRKNPTYYGRFGWSEPDDLPYVWPI